ncbi:ParB/RepB/Spo0J family partition protein [Pseudaquabacterium pictum]|nr:ParB/RepB/Spo0J family partition protein [Rubrivivax pictus]
MTDTTLAAPAAVQPLEGALRIPVGLITPSPLNPRKTWKPEKVAAMAADMAVNAQIQPIRVRPNPLHTPSNGRPPYEIVVGETRWRAAPQAGLDALDAVLRDCTDQELIKLALAENTKRQDLHPLEEADGFAALLRADDGLQGYASKEDLAAAVGVSPSYVYQRLKLRNLCKPARDAFLAGTIDASVALLIARMPDQTEQARATARIVSGFGGEPYSYRQASEFLKREFMLALTLARFDTTATYNVAGPCSACPKRSGAAPDLFADVAGGGDLCQDARCYQAKAEEAHQQLLQAARDAGRTVLQGAAARKVLPRPDAEPIGHYRLDAPCPALTDSQRPLRALLGSGFAGSIVVVDVPGSAPLELVTADAAQRAIKARGLLRSQTVKAAPAKAAPAAAPAQPLFKPKATDSGAGVCSAPAAEPATTGEAPPPRGEGAAVAKDAGTGGAGMEDNTPAPGRGVAVTVNDAATAEALERAKFGELLLAELEEALAEGGEPPLLILRLAITAMWDEASAEECSLLYTVMGWTLDGAYSEDFARRVRVADGAALAGLLMLVLAARDCADELVPAATMHVRPAGVLAKHFGIPLDRVLRDARIAVRGAPVQDATAAFVAAHRPASGADEVSDEASAPRREPVTDPNWEFPKGHI